MTKFPARLHVLLARNGRDALVLRRGPAKAACSIGWDRKRDTFTVGQWLRGRIYERRSDLSPDGAHLIYFAMNGHWSSRARGAWTAISRAPYLTAVSLFAKGDCWHGGGLFVNDDTYWLNDGYGHTLLDDTGELRKADPPPYAPTFGGECWGVYFHRLQRDGWLLCRELTIDVHTAATVVFEKPLWHGWRLRKLAHAMVGAPPGKGVYFDEHELVGDRELMRHTWEWADVDRDRLVWAEAGKLHAGTITKASAKREDPIDGARVLHDFNDMTFEARPAPYAKPTSKPAQATSKPKPKPSAKAAKVAKRGKRG